MAASDSSSEVRPHPSGAPEASLAPPMAQAPKPIALTLMPVRPSSRYCIGNDCTDAELQPHQSDLFDRVDRAERGHRLLAERGVDGDDGHGLPAASRARQVVLGDVDLVIAEERAYLADHAGNVLVDDVQQVSLRLELHPEIVDRHHPLLVLREERTGNADLLPVRAGAEGDEVR